MKLEKAIKILIDTKGPFIIFERDFLQNLIQYGAFEDEPYLQSDFEKLINRGEFHIFKNKEVWTTQPNFYKKIISRKYPFMTDRICYIIESIAFALNYTKKGREHKSKKVNKEPKIPIYYKCICSPNCKYIASKPQKLIKHAIDTHYPNQTTSWAQSNFNNLFSQIKKENGSKIGNSESRKIINSKVSLKKRNYSLDDLVNRGNNYDLSKGT